jgi:hypothetical protein
MPAPPPSFAGPKQFPSREIPRTLAPAPRAAAVTEPQCSAPCPNPAETLPPAPAPFIGKIKTIVVTE